ncbi:hypothetical protein PIB30_016631 [Stylosanthes scabra]|uniref:Uncharacterized protein n=1 Tax=Stylosanthes scabra TaxID=79078 RepID=A0ABU6V798_9FABA|nr:hypothetical protein [Stylosanthes scabra]
MGTILYSLTYYLVRSGALAGGKFKIPQGFRASAPKTGAKVTRSSPTLLDPKRECRKYPKGRYKLLWYCRDIRLWKWNQDLSEYAAEGLRGRRLWTSTTSYEPSRYDAINRSSSLPRHHMKKRLGLHLEIWKSPNNGLVPPSTNWDPHLQFTLRKLVQLSGVKGETRMNKRKRRRRNLESTSR